MGLSALALPALRTALSVGRGGAALASASLMVADSISPLLPHKGSNADPASGLVFSPQGKSVLYMAIAMSFHYMGYSLARPITVALFTSASTGYAGFKTAFPLAMALVSPTALCLLILYGNILDQKGPRGALIQSTLSCAAVLSISAIAVIALERTGRTVVGSIPAVKLITGPLFIFREAYVQLLTSQYWSFMSSVLTPNQSATWFGPIAGLTSISSALAGFNVSFLVRRVGLAGALLGTGLSLLCSLAAASAAYRIAREHGFEPRDTKKQKATKEGSLDFHKSGMIEKANKLFARVPVLGALFVEILTSQGLATVLNVCFVARLGTAIPNDEERAGFVGFFFALINTCTMVLQFGILPPLMTVIEPRDLWRVLPVVSCFFTAFQAFQKDPSLAVVSASLMAMKVSEYSARRMLDEMIYVPLDFESRFVGKEVIGVFGHRFGKSL
jgi:hypothetical protein